MSGNPWFGRMLSSLATAGAIVTIGVMFGWETPILYLVPPALLVSFVCGMLALWVGVELCPESEDGRHDWEYGQINHTAANCTACGKVKP